MGEGWCVGCAGLVFAAVDGRAMRLVGCEGRGGLVVDGEGEGGAVAAAGICG